jgi:Putative glucoamylase
VRGQRPSRFPRLPRWLALPAVLAVVLALWAPPAATAAPDRAGGGLTAAQRAELMNIARASWAFYSHDIDPTTHLPLDNLTYAGGSSAPTSYGRYTSAANIGVYLWAVVAAHDLGLIGRPAARRLLTATLSEVQRLRRSDGFLFQWYDTTTGHVIRNPGDIDCTTEPTPTFDNCYFVSNVDNGWYASGLIVVRQALPELRGLVDRLMAPMDFGLFYDNRPETHCNTNPAIPGNQPTGQMYGGYYAGLPPDQGDNWTHYYHNGALYSDPRISAYIGMGLRQMPGNVWWRSWRVLPPRAPFPDCQATDPDFSWQGQWPHPGYWQTYTDPQSGQQFPVWEGHYVYTGSPDLTFIPTFAGGMFEGLMANEVVPETTWGPRTFGLADVRTAQVQIKYATEQLHYPVWGMSPSSTADDSGGYGGFGVEGLVFPYFGAGADASHPNLGLSQCHGCATEDVVTPHASFLTLDVTPQQAYANIQALRAHFPDVYGANGFFDAVNPTTGSVGHRILVLDQSMIMAALDNALRDRAMQRHFAKDPVSWAARTYLSLETFSIG